MAGSSEINDVRTSTSPSAGMGAGSDTIDQSSATRIGLWSGSTTLPALISMRSVTTATAALVTAGFG